MIVVTPSKVDKGEYDSYINREVNSKNIVVTRLKLNKLQVQMSFYQFIEYHNKRKQRKKENTAYLINMI